ncbi:MAG: helix-turn-helix domain-containing protein [Porphyromonadaceae bacterium]|nr:helix-turn-helix domain-containing protein [Porphyromonadaceae bacterium]
MEQFQIIQPSLLLTPYVKQYWFLKTDIASQPQQRIIPHGSICLIFHKGSNLYSLSKHELQPMAFISGQSTGYSDLLQTGTVDMISVTFQPHGAKAFFSMPMTEIQEATISISEINDPDLNELQDRLINLHDNALCTRLIESFLINRLCVTKVYNQQRMSDVIQSINNGQMDIEKLANTSCLSYKQFKRIFAEYIGANPKDFLRIIRFQKALYTLQIRPQTNLTQLAFECGYYDQPHLIKEFKSFSGFTPGEYIAVCAPYSDYFS